MQEGALGWRGRGLGGNGRKGRGNKSRNKNGKERERGRGEMKAVWCMGEKTQNFLQGFLGEG